MRGRLFLDVGEKLQEMLQDGLGRRLVLPGDVRVHWLDLRRRKEPA